MLYIILLFIIAVLLYRDLKTGFKIAYYEETMVRQGLKDRVKGMSLRDMINS